MKTLCYSLAAFVAVLVSGCSGPRVYSDYVQGINYNQFNTFAWLPVSDSVQNSIYDNEIVMQSLRNKVNEEMQKRGYNINTENPDLLVLMRTNFEQEEQLVRTPVYSSYNYYYPGFYVGPGYPFYYNYYNTIPNIYGYDIQSVEYTEGTIVIDIIRAETKELIWRGWAQTSESDPADVKGKMIKAIEEIFEEYPVDEDKRRLKK